MRGCELIVEYVADLELRIDKLVLDRGYKILGDHSALMLLLLLHTEYLPMLLRLFLVILAQLLQR